MIRLSNLMNDFLPVPVTSFIAFHFDADPDPVSQNDADPGDLQHCLPETQFCQITDNTKREHREKKKGIFAQLYGDSLSDVNATKKILCAPLPSHQICAKRKLSGFIVPLILYKNYKSDHKSE
jgi:hypothetical protein